MSPTSRSLALAALMALVAAVPATLAAQEEPRRGKIDEVERNARSGDDDDDDDGEGGWWGLEIAGDVIKAIFARPKGPGQGYLPYPWAADGAAESFVLHDVQDHRRFGTLTLGRFEDASSSLGATSVAFEGANDALHYSIEYAHYREVKATETDRLDDFRFGIGAAPAVGNRGYALFGVGGRGVCLDSGRCAGGLDFQLGARLFPARPLGLSGTWRIGGMGWEGGSEFLLLESNTALSVFVGRIEVSAGWHWLKLGRASAFAGPTFATRVWF